MHSPFKRDEAGSIPASRTGFEYEGASFNRIRTEPSKLRMSVRVRQRLPSEMGMWSNGSGRTASNREIRVQFSASLPNSGSRGLTHNDASVLTKRSGLDSRREFHTKHNVHWMSTTVPDDKMLMAEVDNYCAATLLHQLLLVVDGVTERWQSSY